MLKTGSDNGHACFATDPRGHAFSFLPLNMVSAVVFLIWSLLY